MSKRGLPETLRMRHDEHYVEALTASEGSPVGRLVPIDLLDWHHAADRRAGGTGQGFDVMRVVAHSDGLRQTCSLRHDP